MRLSTINLNGEEIAAIVTAEGLMPICSLNAAKNTDWPEKMLPLIVSGRLAALTSWYNSGGSEELETMADSLDGWATPCALTARAAESGGNAAQPVFVPFDEAVYAPLYRHPRRIFGIGLNYVDHAGDIGSAAPQGFPGSFFKMADTLIGPGDEILLPRLKEAVRTTAEAELGIIMGCDCRDVAEENWLQAVAGFTTILDMTEESILKGNEFLQGNPRYLTIVKNFPTFFSFGPQLVTPDEVPDVLQLKVQSVLNGAVYAENVVANMTHRPARLVSLHSSIMGWFAGDVLSTGTPRAFAIHEGDVAECRITGPQGFSMEPLQNPVTDLKLHPER